MRREEYNHLVDMLNERGALLNQLLQDYKQLQKDQNIQFQRIAQMQAELDLIRKTKGREIV